MPTVLRGVRYRLLSTHAARHSRTIRDDIFIEFKRMKNIPWRGTNAYVIESTGGGGGGVHLKNEKAEENASREKFLINFV